MTAIAAQLTPTTISSVVQPEADAIANAPTSSVGSNTFVFFAAFDGTWNNSPPINGDTQDTAISQLQREVESASSSSSNVVAKYFAGIGASDTLPDETGVTSVLPTPESIDTAEKAYKAFALAAFNWSQDPAHAGGSITSMVTSFSRGAAAAAIFSQMLYEKGLVFEDKNGKHVLIPPGTVGAVSAALILDPVLTGETGNMDFPPGVQNLTIVRAQNEYRSDFQAAKYSSNDLGDGEKVIQVAGNHGDIGDAYDNGLGGLYLGAYTQFFANAGLPIGSVSPSREYIPLGQSVAVHSETETAAEIIVNRKFWDATYNPNSVGTLDFLNYARQTDSSHGTLPTGTSFTAYNGDIVLYGNGGTSTANGAQITVLAGATASVSGYKETISVGAGATLNFASTNSDPAFASEITAGDGASLTVSGPNVTVIANNANITLAADANNGIRINGEGNHITMAPTARIDDPNGQVAAHNTITLATADDNSTTFSAGNHGALSYDGSTASLALALGGVLPVGTLSINTATDATSLLLSDGFAVNLLAASNDVVGNVTGETPLAALESYLANLGYTGSLTAADSAYQHPTGTSHDVTAPLSVVPNGGDTAVTAYWYPDAPGATISGHTHETVNLGGTPTSLPVAQNVLVADNADISHDTISNMDVLQVSHDISVKAGQLASFSSVVVDSGIGGTVHVSGGGTVSLPTAMQGHYNLTADTWEGTTLVGDSTNGQILTASQFGNDTLTAGSGNGDKLYAGLGVDTLTGGTGTGTEFHAEQGLAAGSTITGNGSSDALYTTGDLSNVALSGIDTLYAGTGSLTLAASQLAGIGTIVSNNQTLYGATGGTYDLSGKFQTGTFGHDFTALSNDGTTVIGNGEDNQTLTASATGHDTITGGTGNSVTLVAGQGVDTLIASGAAGSTSFEAAHGLTAGSTITGNDSGLAASGDISQATTSGITGIGLLGGNSITMTGAQFNALNGNTEAFGTDITNTGDGTPGDLNITTAGTYAITLLDFNPTDYNPTDHMFDMTALSNGGTTLQEDKASDVTLTASASGNDTLISNNSDSVTLDASGTSGSKTLTMDHSTNGELDAEDATGAITFNSSNGTGNILDATGGTGAATFNASTDTGDEIFAGDGTDTVYAGTNATVYGGDGTDTVVAGIGDTIYGGDGNDTYYVNVANGIFGGTGNDTFVANLPFDASTTIDGGGGNDSLYVNNYALWGTANDISLADISNVGTLTDNALNLTLTADQLGGFATLTNTTGTLIPETLAAATAGTYSLAGKTVNGSFNLGAGLGNINVTLIGNGQNGQTLIGGQGTDTLQAGNGNNVTLIAGTGNTTLIAGTGTDALVGGNGTDTFVLGGSSGPAGLALANGAFTYNGTTQVFALGSDSVTVQHGENATITGSDGTMTVNNNASGGVVQNTINWSAGGSKTEQFYTMTGGAWREEDQGHTGANGTGTQLWTDTISHAANGAVNVDIAGTGGTFSQSNATFNAADATTATLTGDGNTVQVGDNSTITFAAGADNDFAFCSDNNTIIFNGFDARLVAYGGGNTVYLNGNSNFEQDQYDGVDADNSPGNNTFIVNGNGNQLSLAVDNDVATVNGNNNMLVERHSNDSITVGGTGNFAEDVGTGNTVVVNGTGNQGQIYASGTLTMGGNANSAWCNSNNNTVTVGGTNNNFVAYGNGNTITLTGTGGYATDNAPSTGSNGFVVTGNSDQLNLTKAGDTATLSGSSDLAVMHGSGEAVTDSGTGNTSVDAGTGANTATLSGTNCWLSVYNTTAGTVNEGGTNSTVVVLNAITGNGTVNVTGSNDLIRFDGATTDEIIFGSGATGKLLLNSAASFAGTVAGLASGDSIDLHDFLFSGTPTISSVTGTGAAGTATDVTVTDGSKSLTLALLNQYANQFAVSASAYALSADAGGGSAGTLFQLAAGH